MRDQKEFLPKIRRHPRSQCACDKQAASDIFPYCRQIHDEVVTGCSETILGTDALQERASCHAHVHFGVTFHLAFESPLRLCARFGNKFVREKHSEQQRHQRDHQPPAQEFSGHKLSHSIANAIQSAWPRVGTMSMIKERMTSLSKRREDAFALQKLRKTE